MSPVVITFLWCCMATTAAIVSIKAMLGGRIPASFMPWHWSDKSSDDAQRAARLQTIPVGLIFLLVVIGFIAKGITMLDSGSRHDLLVYSWHGLTLHNILGAIAMLLGVGMLRIAFLKQLPQAMTRALINIATPQKQDNLLTLKAALIVFGLLVAEVGVLLYYFVTPTT